MVSFNYLLYLLYLLMYLESDTSKVHDDIGRGPFLAVYFSSAVVAAYIPMVIYVLTNNLVSTTLGASGVLTALIATGCVLHEG